MSYADFGSWFFAAKLAGCFLAFMIALRGPRDSQVLTFAYGAWLAFVFGLTHTLLTDPEHNLKAPQILGYWWYLFQAVVAMFVPLCAWALKQAGARKVILILGAALVATNLTFFVAAAPWLVGYRLPGGWFFQIAATLETLQVLALIGLNRPARRVWTWAGKALIKHWRGPWAGHKRLATPRL